MRDVCESGLVQPRPPASDWSEGFTAGGDYEIRYSPRTNPRSVFRPAWAGEFRNRNPYLLGGGALGYNRTHPK
jgi:hypothetical protein